MAAPILQTRYGGRNIIENGENLNWTVRPARFPDSSCLAHLARFTDWPLAMPLYWPRGQTERSLDLFLLICFSVRTNNPFSLVKKPQDEVGPWGVD